MVPHIRTVKTASGARAVQIVHSHRGGKRTMEHIGSAHTDAEHAALMAVARQKLAAGQLTLDITVPGETAGHSLDIPITGTRLGVLWEILDHAYMTLGFHRAVPTAGRGVDVFKALVLARIIEPTSKLDTLRLLAEHGLPAPTYKAVQRHLPTIAKPEFRGPLAVACAAHTDLSPSSLGLYDVTTLLCRYRHNRVYADVPIMPMSVASGQVR